jgi:hypothetical protein
MVEDYSSLGYSRYQERPTVQLEKDHGVLDRAVRRYTHIKSFAYLIFPDSGGMENIAGARIQMTTVRSLAAVLKSDIQEYGHAYDRNEIDQLYSIVNDCLSPPSPGSGSVSYTRVHKKPKQRSPIWMRLVQVLGAIAVLAVVVLVIANPEWGSNFLKKENIHLPSVNIPFLKEKNEKPVEAARNNPTSNTALIPSRLVYDGSTQAEYDHFAAEYGMASVQKEADGSLTMSSEKNLIHANVDALVAALSKKCGQSGYEQFTSIAVNEDYTAFTIVVNDVKMTDEEKQAVTDLFLMAGLQAVQTEQAVRNIQVERVNMLGGVISREETNP